MNICFRSCVYPPSPLSTNLIPISSKTISRYSNSQITSSGKDRALPIGKAKSVSKPLYPRTQAGSRSRGVVETGFEDHSQTPSPSRRSHGCNARNNAGPNPNLEASTILEMETYIHKVRIREGYSDSEALPVRDIIPIGKESLLVYVFLCCTFFSAVRVSPSMLTSSQQHFPVMSPCWSFFNVIDICDQLGLLLSNAG